jgi:tetratricopeptide (TPR) repeat protein
MKSKLIVGGALLGSFLIGTIGITTLGTKANTTFNDINTQIQANAFQSAELIYLKVHEAMTRKDYDLAISFFTQAINTCPTYAIAYLQRGRAQHGKGECAKAIEDFNLYFQIGPPTSDAHNCRGLALFVCGKASEAIADFSDAIRLEPQNHLSFWNRGIAYMVKSSKFSDSQAYSKLMKQSYLEKAWNDFSEAIRLCPQHEHTNISKLYADRGAVCRLMGAYSPGIEDCNSALGFDQHNATALAQRGACWANLNHFANALADLNQAIALDPSFGFAFAQRSLVHKTLGNWQQAWLDRQAAIQLGIAPLW